MHEQVDSPKPLTADEAADLRPDNPAIQGVSVVIPAYNEESAIGREIEMVEAAMRGSGCPYEIIVVDDGSNDETAAKAERFGVEVVRLWRNRGYGAALKAGIARARFEWIVITDADGTYPASAIPALLSRAGEFDMVVGARVKDGAKIPLVRRPAKWFLRRLAEHLAEQTIPDLNSGLRVIRKRLVERFEHLLPSGFSFTTTITMALICSGFAVAYHPIEYHRRIGESKIRPGHALQFLVLILRTIMLFNPLRVFLPVGGLAFLAGFAKLGYDLLQSNVSDSAVMGILAGILIWSVGLLADQNARFNMMR